MSEATNEPVTMMDYHMDLAYHEVLCPVVQRYADQLMQGRMIGHKCPSCGLVYAPPRGYCPICVVETTDADEVQLAERGVITNYTVVTPVEYHGQEKTDRFAKVSLLLDGGGTLSLQDVIDLPVDDVRIGMRMEAVWAPESERNVDDISNRSWGGAENVLRGWRPTGEPDVPAEEFSDKVF